MNTEAMKPVSSSLSPQAQPTVILLVEDESIVREITREVLQHAGYRVLECGSPGEALQVAGAHAAEIDLLLTDVVLPEMNGADLARRLQNILPDLVTVFMSGYAEGEIAQRISRISAVHIQKPFTVDVLLTRIGEALQAGLLAGRRAHV